MKLHITKIKIYIFFLLIGVLAGIITHCINPGHLMRNQNLILGSLEVGETLIQLFKEYDHEFAPKEEYFIGRSVAAFLITETRIDLYSEDKNTPLDDYINKIGHTLVKASDRPGTYQGYRFIVAKSKRVNAYAVPSGFIFITTGLINLCENEDELAGVLAHEISHIVLKHPTKSIEEYRKAKAIAGLIKTASSSALSSERGLGRLTNMFGDIISEVRESVLNGYNSAKEKEADLQAVELLVRAGYNPRALSSVLRKLKVGGGVHGDPSVRADQVDRQAKRKGIKGRQIASIKRVRTRRFNQIIHLSDIR
ncbi:MAG: peptidase M48 [bacterium]|nr:MAG: peptidase M48 [bacterium]